MNARIMNRVERQQDANDSFQPNIHHFMVLPVEVHPAYGEAWRFSSYASPDPPVFEIGILTIGGGGLLSQWYVEQNDKKPLCTIQIQTSLEYLVTSWDSN